MYNDSGAVNRNTPHSPPVSSMFKEIAQYLKFFRFSTVWQEWRQRHNDDVIAKILHDILKGLI